jgi:tryptophanyl-tRNA synthetase
VTGESVVLSGMRSTGKLHLGNYFGAVRNWVELQDRYDCYYFVADWHALTTEYADPSDIGDHTLEVVADYLASGLDPDSACLFIQSRVPEHAELHLLLSMVVPLPWLERVPTYKEQIRELDNRDLATFGFLGYPVLQTADIILYRADFVPVGEDQASHLELSREICRRFNGFYGPIFPEPKALFTPTPKVPGLDGRKMSKSYANTIDLADEPDEIRRKCQGMFTDPLRQRRNDPGHPESCNLFQFHLLVSPEETQQEVARDCRLARIGCVDDKRLIAERLIEFLTPIRERRAALMRDRSTLLDIVRDGSRRARERAGETMERVRAGLAMSYDGGSAR